MQTERFENLSDDELKAASNQAGIDADMYWRWRSQSLTHGRNEEADRYCRLANSIAVQRGCYNIEIDRRAVERLGIKEGDKLLNPKDKSIITINHIGNYSAGLDYVIVDAGGKSFSVNEALTMKTAYCEVTG